MRARTRRSSAATLAAAALSAVAGTLALTAVPVAAQAASSVQMIDRSAYATTFEQTAGTLHFAGATRGELGGYLDVVVTAVDGGLPVGSNVCEPARVSAALTVSPGEVLTARVRGEVCTGFSGDSLTVNAGITRNWQLTYAGTAHRSARLAGEGLVAASVVPGLGGQASFFVPVRWCD